MKTLREDLHDLLALQEIDTQIERAKTELAGLDNGAKALAAYQAKKAETEALRSAANKAQATQRDAELKLASIETKAAQVNKTLYGGSVVSAREMENLQKELEMLGRQKNTTEEAVLEAMEAAGAAVSAMAAAEKELAQLAVRFKKTRVAFEARHKELATLLESLKAPRDAAQKLVTSPELLTRYEAIRSRRHGSGAATLTADNTCGSCGLTVSLQSSTAVRAGESIQTCESCGRILAI